MHADPGFNVLEINIRNLKEFIKTKEVDEEVGSYIGFVIDILQKECQQLFASDLTKTQSLDSMQEQLNKLRSKYDILKAKRDSEVAAKKYRVFEESLVQYKDNPKELVWEFKRLMLDNEIKQQEISFLKNMLQDMKTSEHRKGLQLSFSFDLEGNEQDEQLIDIQLIEPNEVQDQSDPAFSVGALIFALTNLGAKYFGSAKETNSFRDLAAELDRLAEPCWSLAVDLV